MTTLDDTIIPDVVDLIADLGKSVVFRTYPSRTVDETTSQVTNGTATDYTVLVSPPYKVMVKITEDGRATHVEASRIILPTGYGTSSAIAFSVERGMEVIFDGATARIIAYAPIYSGDLVAAYVIDLAQ